MNHRPPYRFRGAGVVGKLGVLLTLLYIALSLQTVRGQTDAEDKPLVVTGANWAIQPRNSGLMTIDLFVDNKTQNIIRGDLHLIEPILRSDITSRVVLPDVVLRPGQQKYIATLPPADRSIPEGFTELQAELHSGRDVLDLGLFTVSASQDGQRNLCIAVSNPWGGRYAPYEDVVRLLYPQRVLPTEAAQWLNCSPNNLKTVSLPTTPLRYCGFDLLVLMAEGFTSTNASQLRAIETWHRAGGAVYIHIDTDLDDLSAEHLQFLGRITDNKASLVNPPEQGELILQSCDLGVIGMTYRKLPDERQARQLAAHLWRFRHHYRDKIINAGTLEPKPSKASDVRRYGWQFREYRWTNYDPNRHLMEPLIIDDPPILTPMSLNLLPGSIQLVPLKVIAILLSVLVFVIGPLDYFVLGFIRKRQYTWITLPLAIAMVTWAFFAISDHYLGRSSTSRSIYVLDYNRQGAIVRMSTFTQLFSADTFEMQQELNNELAIQMLQSSPEALQQARWQASAPMYYNSAVEISYQGSIPASYTMSREVQKWAPVLQRHTQLGVPAEPPKDTFDFSQIDPQRLTTPEGRIELAIQIYGANLDQNKHTPQLLIMHMNEAYLAQQNAKKNIAINSGDSQNVNALHLKWDFFRLSDVVEQLSAREQFGWFNYISNVSPLGGNTIEDLNLLDTTDPDQWLLVVCQQRGNDFYLHRALYRLPEEE